MEKKASREKRFGRSAARLAYAGAALALLAPALYNGFPLLMKDSWRFLHEATGDYHWITSQFYGHFLRIFLGSSLWLVVTVQALLALYVLDAFFRRVCGASQIQAALAITALALTSSLALFVGAVMTDILLGLGVVAMAVLVLGERSRFSDATMAAVVAFAAAAHPAALALLALLGGALIAILFGLRVSGRDPARRTAAWPLAAGIAVAVAAVVINNAVIWGKPRPNPHSAIPVFAYLFLNGDLDAMLEGCTQWRVCTTPGQPQRAARTIFTWYLHSPQSPLHAKLGGPEAYVDEATEIVSEYVTHHPIAYARRVAATAWEQLFMVSFARHTRIMTRHFHDEHPYRLDALNPGDGPRLSASRQYKGEFRLNKYEKLFTLVAWFGVVAALGGAAAGLAVGAGGAAPWPPRRKRIALAALLMVAAYVIQAFVIGTSVYPVERYGARVQWLLALGFWMWAPELYRGVRMRRDPRP